MELQQSTQEKINQLIAFRQTIYAQGLNQQRDAQFELIDALLTFGPVRSFAEWSLAPLFHRAWPSLYSALDQGRQDEAAIRRLLAQQLPSQGILTFPLDATAWYRPDAPTLPDRQYCHGPSPIGLGDAVGVGYPYSVLAWAAEIGTCWTLPLDIERIGSDTNPVAVGVQQIKRVLKLLPREVLPIFVADGGYGNSKFFQPLKEERCGLLARLRVDRVLYRKPGPYGGIGRPCVHGERFAFKEPDTWGEPNERETIQDPKWGIVVICSWEGLHALDAADTPFRVICIQTHTEREKLPKPLWLGWKEPTSLIERPIEGSKTTFSMESLWRFYPMRWGIEPSIQWRKQDLGWTLPQLRSKEACDRWTTLVTLAQWQLHFARPLVSDAPLPWQKPQARPTPSRVQRRLGSLFAEIGTPAQKPKTRGKSPGWPKGRERTRPPRYPIVKKTTKRKKKTHKPPQKRSKDLPDP